MRAIAYVESRGLLKLSQRMSAMSPARFADSYYSQLAERFSFPPPPQIAIPRLLAFYDDGAVLASH